MGIGQAVSRRHRRSAGQQVLGLRLVDVRSGGPARLTGALRLAGFELLCDALLSIYVIQPMARVREAARADRLTAAANPPAADDLAPIHGGEFVLGPGCLVVITYVLTMLVPLGRGRSLPHVIAGTMIIRSP